MAFTIRQLNSHQSLGERLKSLRHLENKTLLEMAEKTKINKAILQAFEENAFDKLPESLYARQFLKTYVRALKGDERYFLERFDADRGTCDYIGSARLPRKRARRSQFLVASRFVKIAILSALFLGVASYLGYQLKTLITPPELVLLTPEDGLVTTEATVLVSGEALDNAHVFVNGNPVLLNKDGSFELELPLERGVNIIRVEGSKRYSRTASLFRRVVLNQEG